MRCLAALLAIIPTTALAQAVPYKLVVSWGQGGVTITDYPNAARCEIGRRAVEQEVARRNRAFLATLPPGSTMVSGPTNGAFCIPG